MSREALPRQAGSARSLDRWDARLDQIAEHAQLLADRLRFLARETDRLRIAVVALRASVERAERR